MDFNLKGVAELPIKGCRFSKFDDKLQNRQSGKNFAGSSWIRNK